MSETIPHTWVFAAIGLVGGLLWGCGPDRITEKEAESYVDEWANQGDEALARHVESVDAETRFEKLVRKRANKQQEETDRTKPPYDVLARDVYSNLDWKLVLADRNRTTDRGGVVREFVTSAGEHGLDEEAFETKAVAERIESVEKLSKRIEALSSYEPSRAAREKLREWLTGKSEEEFRLESDNYPKLVDVLRETEVGERLVQRVDEIERLRRKRANRVAELELLLARNTLRYARKLKHFRVPHRFVFEREDDYWRNPNTDGERPDEAKGPFVAGQVWRKAAKVADSIKEPVEILHRRMRRTLRRVLERDEPSDVFADLAPDHPQYAALKKAYDKYRSIVEKGGWSEVAEASIGPGETDETVGTLKRRLRSEGYFPEDVDVDNHYGDTLVSAVEDYQETHQMEVTGEPHDAFWSSLDKPATWRLKQIRLNLRRWRESNVRHSDPLYVLVNIAGSHVEIWKHQDRKMRFRIVVGNNDVQYSNDKQKAVHPNRTPQVSAYIDRVIFNPYWNVTDRIRATEILPEVRRSVEQSYKAKLRAMRKKKRRLTDDSTDGGGGASAEKSSSEEDGHLVAQGGPLADLSGAEGDDTDGDSGSDDGGSASAEADGDETDDGDDGSKEGGDGEPSVSIDDLYRMVDAGPQSVTVDRKAVFDVEKIRTLIRDTRNLAGDSTSNGDEASGGSDSASGGDSTSSSSPLTEKFPYLDPETGTVDVSETDPDHIPAWYKANNYEVVYPGTDGEYVRMQQGDGNALGRVKVIFPNKHSIYLHDTPKTHLFDREVRAFSHGCMRMDKPLKFAKYLLKQRGLLEEVDLDRILEERVRVEAEHVPGQKWKYTYPYRPVYIDNPIPVHVDYFTVRIDDEGRPHFFADIYDRDDKRIGDDDEGE